MTEIVAASAAVAAAVAIAALPEIGNALVDDGSSSSSTSSSRNINNVPRNGVKKTENVQEW